MGSALQQSGTSFAEYLEGERDVEFRSEYAGGEIYGRRTNWQVEAFRAEDNILLESIDLELPVTDIYRRVRREVGLDIPPL